MKDKVTSVLVVLGFVAWVALVSLSAQKKPAPAPALEPCAPTQVTPWPNGVDPSLDWTRALNNLHSRLDQLEVKFDMRPTMDPEVEDLHRRLWARPWPTFDGVISGTTIVITPRADAPVGRQ